jgi:hypothetical protein
VVVFPGSGCEVTKHWIPVGIADLVDGKPGWRARHLLAAGKTWTRV